MGIYGYNCYNFCHDINFGGSNYISGTTCDGVVGAYFLTLGQCICMDLDFPLITCENPIFSGECVPSTPTPTTTPTITSTPTNTMTPTNTSTPTMTPTPSATPCICFPQGTGFNYTQGSVLALGKDDTLNRLYVGGNYSTYNGNTQVGLTALDLTTSNVISGFSGNNTGIVIDLVVQSDGKILIGGILNNWKGVSSPRNFMRINTDGTRDTSFISPGTGFTGEVYSIHIDPNGKILVGGVMTNYNGSSIPPGLIRLNSDGSVDTTFSGITSGFTWPGGGLQGVREIVDDGSGGYFISGNLTSYNGTACNDVLRLNSDGSLNGSYNLTAASGVQRVLDIDVDTTNQRVYVLNIPNQGNIYASDFAGNFIWSANTTTFVEGNYIERQSDGKLIIGGRQILTGANVMRYTSGGTIDATFTSPTFTNLNQPSNGVFRIIIDDNDSCYIIGGSWTSVNGFIGTQVARLYSNGALDQCTTIPVSPTPTPSITASNTSTPTSTPSVTPTQTPTNTSTPTNTETPTQTPTLTPTSTCPSFTTQYMEVDLQSCHNFSLKLFDNPNLTGNANAVCDVIVSGCAYGDLGTIYCGTETIASGDHVHNFSLQPVLQPGECVSAFTVSTITEQCPCYEVIYVPVTPTPTTTSTPTSTPSVTPTQTPTTTTTSTPSSTPPSLCECWQITNDDIIDISIRYYACNGNEECAIVDVTSSRSICISGGTESLKIVSSGTTCAGGAEPLYTWTNLGTNCTIDGDCFGLPTSTPTTTPSNSPTPSITPSNSPTPSITPSNTGTPLQTPTNTSTPTQTPTPSETSPGGQLFIYGKFINSTQEVGYTINSGTYLGIGDPTSSCSFLTTISGLQIGDVIDFMTIGTCAIGGDLTTCPAGTSGCNYQHTFNGTTYIYLTIDASNCC